MRGIVTALVTPFDSKNELDIAAFRRILRDQVAAEVSGVLVCGTTGEAPTLSTDETQTLILTAIQELKGTGVEVWAGTGTNSTKDTLELSTWAAEQGVDGLTLVTPYYNKPSQAGMEAHFLAVANAVKCEILLYNIPGRTGVCLTPETIARLAAHPRICYMKDSSGNLFFVNEVLQTLSQNKVSMDLFSGDDALYMPFLSVGAVGVVSVASNLIPRQMVAIQRAMENSHIEEAIKIHRRFVPLFRDLFVETNPVPIKYAMEYAGWCNASVRLPLAPLTSASIDKLKESLKLCGITPGVSV